MRLAVLALTTGCVAPPMGIGTGGRIPPDHRQLGKWPASDGPSLQGGVGVGIAPHREVVQLEGSANHRFGPTFSLEYGAAFTEVGIGSRPSVPAPPETAERSTQPTSTTSTLVSIGVLPYVRPRWQLGRLSIALAGMFMVGGTEEAAMGMFADAQIGFGGERWSIYAGAYGLGYIDSFGTSVMATQTRLGAELWGGNVGIAVEAFTGMDATQVYEESKPTSLRFTGAGIKLKLAR